MPAQVQGVAIGLPFSSSSSSSSGSLERRAGAGERAVRSGALSSSAQRGEAQLSRGRVRGSVFPPRLFGGWRILVSLLGFSVSIANSRVLGTAAAKPPLQGAAGWALRGAGTPWEPPGPELEGEGGRGACGRVCLSGPVLPLLSLYIPHLTCLAAAAPRTTQ